MLKPWNWSRSSTFSIWSDDEKSANSLKRRSQRDMRKTRYMWFSETRKKEVFRLEWSVVATIAYRSSKIQTEIDLAVNRSLVTLTSSFGGTLGVKSCLECTEKGNWGQWIQGTLSENFAQRRERKQKLEVSGVERFICASVFVCLFLVIYSFVDLWLYWACIAAPGLSLVASCGGYSS